jgi:hypothetical protein
MISKTSKTKRRLSRGGLLLALLTVAATAHASSALAEVSLRIEAGSNTTVAPGGQLTYLIGLRNVGESNTDGSQLRLTIALPAGLSGLSINTSAFTNTGTPLDCPGVAGAQLITCTGEPFFPARIGGNPVKLTVGADPAAKGVLTAAFEVEGAGATEAARTVDPATVSSVAPVFGLDAFDLTATKAGVASTQAAGHPDTQITAIDYNTRTDPSPVVGSGSPVEDARDVAVELPAGFFGNPAALPRCSQAQLVNGGFTTHSLCALDSQVGTVRVRSLGGTLQVVPLFNMEPPPGAPARFGFDVAGNVVVLDAHPRASGDYGLTVGGVNVPQGLQLSGQTVTFWGMPAAAAHDTERSCVEQAIPWEGGETCASDAPPSVFFRNPTSCEGPAALGSGVRLDSWQHPGDFVEASIPFHGEPGYPYPSGPSAFPAGYSGPESWGPDLGTEGCDQVPFEPTLDAELTTDRADSPSGISVEIGLPSECWDAKASEQEAEDSLCQSDMREARVTLPRGISINPSAAGGRQGCTPAQIGLSTPLASAPVHFDEAPVSCPDASKIGTVEIETPLLGLHDVNGEPVTDEAGRVLPEPLTGAVYLAQQSQNPFGSLLGMYLVAEGSGVRVKQAGEITLGPDGQITTAFHEAPQTPFSKIHVELFGGPRAPLRTPATCATYTAQATLTPWSNTAPVQRQSSFGVSQACGGGFDPQLSAGTQNPLAGKYSPLHLRLTREDATQEIAGLSATLAPGLIGKPAGIPYCPDSVLASFPAPTLLGAGAGEIASPRCPAASQLGTVTVGAGAGPTPFYTATGKAYLAGPYKGAPLSLAVLAPAVAGPFDLGTVLVRNALRVNPETAQVSALSDPLPTLVHGIALDLRDIRVDLNRPDFTLNPTSCEPLAIAATLTSAQGTLAQRSSHFQAANCDRLAFKPKLSLRLKGDTRRSGHPALTAILKARPGDANIGRVQVALPHSEFLAQSHIKTICTRVQFAAGSGGGAQCPKGSVYGKVTATSPLVDYPLTGNAYLRSSANPLPDIVLALHGPPSQPLQVDAVGRIDSVNGGIRTTFAAVPDAPLTKVVLRLPGGKKSLLENSTDLCRSTSTASVRMDAHNGKLADSGPELKVKCPKSGKSGKQRRSQR